MPLHSIQKLQPEGELGLWKVEEPESWFRERLSLYPEEQQQIDQMKGRRRIEWLASRYLLHRMSGRAIRGACLKDANGKPQLEASPYQISISHSHGMVAVIAVPEATGIDIQYLVPKIERIAHKFMRPEEMESLQPEQRIEHLHVYWGAKECLYKAYGRKELDFCRNLLVEPFTYQESGGACRGQVKKGHYQASFHLSYQLIDSYVLVHCRENKG